MTWISIPYNCRKQLFPLLFALVSFTFSFAQNPIVTENALPGNPFSEWGLQDGPDVFKDDRIAGFATQISVNSGETVRFKINVQNGAAYTIKIYRIGYYAGNGARLIDNLGLFTGTEQPAPITDITTGLVDCGNWSESAHWDVPASAVSGLYIAKLVRTGGGTNHIVFIVRNDAPDLTSGSDILLQFPDATWQAYNWYGGNNFYNGTTSDYPAGHAVKSSYNRPFFIRNAGGNGADKISDWYMNNEYPMIRWLERNGYDVTYTTNVDAASRPDQLLYHKIFISLGHDEYWSKEQRDNVTAARNAGVHLAFFSGNEVYWKTRWEDNYRTLVCYKEGFLAGGSTDERVCGYKCDPTDMWTGLWRIGGAPYGTSDNDFGNPENELTGQMSWDEGHDAIQVPSVYKRLRFWRNTAISNLATGQTATLAPNTLGYEWDWEQYPDSYPKGRITMSGTTLNNHTHKLSLYRHSSGALVFGAGTVQWSWGLDNEHYDNETSAISKDMQQATVNLFADMDVQPATMQADLIPATKSADVTAPVSAILSPANDTYVFSGSAVTITGNATDADGVVAGVEVSVDGGVTWHIADINTMDGNVTWSYSWTTTASDTFNVKSRGFDDSGNSENPGTGINIIVGDAVCPCTIFQPTDVPADIRNDGQPIEVGVKFRSSQNGYITGIRFYKAEGDTGTHIGHLWSSTGMMLAEATFINESDSGWQQVLFTAPVAITAGTTYVASYFSSAGDYVTTNPFFTQAVVNGPLRALANGEDGPNGVYIYSATSAFPINNFETSNYSADVVFTTAISPDVTPPTVFSVSPVNDAVDISVYTSIVANFDEVIDTSTVTNSSFELRDAANILVPAAFITADNQLILVPEYALNYSSSYTATIKAGVKDLAGNTSINDYSWTFTTIANTDSTFTIFKPEDTPADIRNDGQPIEVGVRFRSIQNGYITGIRFYKGAGSTGTHIGHLWSNTGTMLAEATFINESDSGWQQVLFTTPVSITAGTTYIASYFSSSGDYVTTNPFFTQAVVNGPLRALANGEDGPNGVYIYTATSAFPTNNYESSNYWADVVFATGISPDATPPTIFSVSPVNGAADVSVYTSVTANFDELIDASTVTNSTIELRDASNTLIPAAVSTVNNQVILIPVYSLNYSSSYTATIKAGIKDLAGNASINDYSWTFTTVANGGSTFTIFQTTDVPADPRNDFGQAIEVGVKFRSVQNGYITGIRFYKGEGSTATHIGHLWSNTGTMLAEATFINESASGWQEALFTAPVAITAGTTYVASYFSSTGDYASTNPFFTKAVINGPLRALASGEDGPNGVYIYSDGPAFPTNNYETSNYWADVIFTTSSSGTTAPVVTTQPVSQTICAGTNVSFTSAASGMPAPTVQWQVSTNGTTWQNISAADSTLTFVPAITDNNKQYRAVWTNSAGSANSDPAILTVNAKPAAPVITVVDNCGNSVLTASAYTGTLLWSNGATTESITMTTAGIYTVTQTVDGCVSEAGNGTASPKATPVAPIVTVVDNCGNSILTASSYTGTLLWGNGATTDSITVTTAGTYTVTQTVDGCVSEAGNGTVAPKATPVAPTVTVVNNCGNSVLTASGYTGTLLWSNGETTESITVSNAATYSVTQTVDGCTSAVRSVTSAPKPLPATPTISVWGATTFCQGGFAILTSSATSRNVWSTGATSRSIIVTTSGNYFVKQTGTNSCSSLNSSTVEITVIPRPTTPTITVVNNCGNSVLTASDYTGTLLWSNGATTESITVTNSKTYTVRQTVNGCTSAAASAGSAPKARPPAPTIAVVNTCGYSVLTATNYTGTLLWSNGATTPSITVTNAGTYTVTQTANGCTSAARSATAVPKAIPPPPAVSVVNNCGGNSVLTASGYTGTLLWSNGAKTASITVTNSATYTVKQTVNGCTSMSGSGTSALRTIPTAPNITVANNCGNAELTASGYTGTLLWSNGATTPSITVTNAATFTVRQTVNGCTSAARSATSAPKTLPATPTISVWGPTTFCQGGFAMLTSSSSTGNIWSTGATSRSIFVNASGSYTVRYIGSNGCSSPNSVPTVITVNSGPVLSSNLTATITSGTAFNYTPTSTTPGTTFTWSRALTTGISNPASSGSGSINQILVNTTNAAVNVTYVYTLTANGCTNTQNVIVTVIPAPVACSMNSSITANMNSSYIPSGRSVWLSSVFDPSDLGTTGAVNFYVTNNKITATVSGQPVTINIPNARIRFDANVTSATTQFINNVWETQVPLNFNGNVFMGGLAFVSSGIPGGLTNITWSATISCDRAGVSVTRKWAAAVYTNFSSNAGLNIKAVDGNIQNPYANYDKAGTPENYKQYVVSGGTGYGGTNYTGNYSNVNTLTCSAGFFTKQSSGQPTQPSSVQTTDQLVDKVDANPIAIGWDVKIMPNPSTNYFTLIINGNNDNPATVRVLSVFGQVVEKHEKVSAKTALRIGQALTGGTYFAEIIQGDQRKVVKIIKIN